MKKLLKRKGFTLVECIVAIAVFALMSALVMQILALSIRQYRSNHHIEMDMDAQIQNIVDYNNLTQKETTDVAIEFMKGSGDGGTAGSIEINDVAIKKPVDNPDALNRLELNTFDAEIKNDGSNKQKQNGGMITEDIHCYGAKGITEITLSTTEETLDNGMKKITVGMQIDDNDYILSSAECNAVKLVLPGLAQNINVAITDGGKLGYLRLSKSDESINYRFYDKNVASDSQDALFTATITFEMTEEDYNTQYQSFAKYFIDPKSDLETLTASFDDSKTPGIYNNKK